MASIRLELPVPPSVNNLFVNRTGTKGGRFKSARYKRWLIDADAHYVLQKLGRVPPISGPYAVEVTVPAYCRADIDNLQKCILDFLKTRGLTDDDKHARKVSIERKEGLQLCQITVTGLTS